MADDGNDYSDLISALGDISANQEKQDVLKQQLSMAQMMRQQPAQGRMAGKMYIPPSALQQLGPAISNATAARTAASQVPQMAGLAAQDQRARQMMMAALLRQHQQGAMNPSQALPQGQPNPVPNSDPNMIQQMP